MKRGKKGTSEYLLVRIFILSLFVFFINVWCLHHLGNLSWKLPVANSPLLLVAIVSFFKQFLEKEEKEKFSKMLRRWFFFFAETEVLIFLFCVFLIAGSMISSVMVMAGGVSEKAEVHLTSEGKARDSEKSSILEKPNDVLRFIRFTTPFGRSFYIEVKGYLRYSFDLYPWIGKKIRVMDDLTVTPSIIIRVPTGVSLNLENGRIAVYSNSKEIAGKETNKNQGALLIGRNLPIPSSFIERWRLELIAFGVDKEAPAARSILRWQTPLIVDDPTEPIIPGKSLLAKFLTKEGKTKAKAKFIVGTEKIQDILMSIEEERP